MGEENSRIHFRFLKSEKINCYHLFENEKKYDLKSPFAFVVKDLSIGGTCKAGLEFIATPNNLILELKAFLKNTTSELEENWLK